jgi:hypothetical protein
MKLWNAVIFGLILAECCAAQVPAPAPAPAPTPPPTPAVAPAPPAPQSPFDRKAAVLEDAARKALEAFVAARIEADAARQGDRIRLGDLNLQGTARVADPAIDARRRALLDLELASRNRIESALDGATVNRYRELFVGGNVAAAEPVLDALMARLKMASALPETRPTEDAERRIIELREKRRAIDEALELATRELVRQRAEKLRTEAERRRAKEEAADELERARALAGDAGGRQAEIRKLRDELDALRKEVEALREKAGPK